METPIDFRGAEMDITSIYGRNDGYWNVELEFKKPISVKLYLHDRINDPAFFEDVPESDPGSWVIEESEYTDRSWGDDLEECLDAFYADFSFERMLMEEGHEHHAQSLIDQIEKRKAEAYDPSSFIETNKIGWTTQAKEWLKIKLRHEYQYYFQKLEFNLRSVTARIGTEIKTEQVKADLFVILESKAKEWHYAVNLNEHGVSSGGKASTIKQALEMAVLEYGGLFKG